LHKVLRHTYLSFSLSYFFSYYFIFLSFFFPDLSLLDSVIICDHPSFFFFTIWKSLLNNKTFHELLWKMIHIIAKSFNIINGSSTKEPLGAKIWKQLSDICIYFYFLLWLFLLGDLVDYIFHKNVIVLEIKFVASGLKNSNKSIWSLTK
jgi:hypothetical protein